MFGRTKDSGSTPRSEVKNWYRDRYESALVWRNILVTVTALSLLLAAVAALAVVQLVPSKTVEPFLIQVEDKTGITQIVDPRKAKELTANEAVNNYFIAQFIKAREGYDNNYQLYNNNVVRLMTAPELYRAYRTYMSAENPESPLVRLAYTGTRSVEFRSITYIDDATAQVRFSVQERLSPTAPPTLINRIALLKFDYNLQVESQQDRFVNPLGFRVTSYRVDEETIQ